MLHSSNLAVSPDCNTLLISYTHLRGPIPWEQIDIELVPLELSGVFGSNRERHRVCQLEADTDLEAIATWLQENEHSKQTYRVYRKEVERLISWTYLTQQKPLSSLTREDINDYYAFLADPQPLLMWCARRYNLRTSPEWRPFEGGLADRSRKHSMTVLGSLFSYLFDMGYLSGNPMIRWGKKRQTVETESNNVLAQDNYLDKKELNLLFETLETAADQIQKNDAAGLRLKTKYERWLFLVRFLVNTGMRRDELAIATIRDMRYETHAMTNESKWFMMVKGKGSKYRKIIIPSGAMRAWARYQEHHQHTASPMGGDCPLLLSAWGGEQSSLSGQAVYSIVKEALTFGQEALFESHPQIAAKFLKATPHWLRRSFATIASQHKISIQTVQLQLGHSSIETTAIYMKDDQFIRGAEFDRMEI